MGLVKFGYSQGNLHGCNPYDVGFGEITFEQDSVNPFKFYFKIATINAAFCSLQRDSCEIEWECPWTGIYGYLPLIDTQFINRQYPTQTYGGWHTFDTIPPDSLITVTFDAMGRAGSLNNFGNSSQTPFSVQVVLNMAYLAHHTGVRSAYFNSKVKVYANAGDVLYFDPQIQHEPEDSLWVTLTLPMADCFEDAGIFYPTDYLQSSHNVMSTYAPTGLLIWDAPPLGDANSQWDIAYMVKGYRNGVFAYSMMRDMLIYVQDPTTGIDETAVNGLSIYPSPATDRLVVNMPLIGLEVSVTDISGRTLDVKVSDQEIDVSSLPLGMYFLRLGNGNGIKTMKFIKQ